MTSLLLLLGIAFAQDPDLDQDEDQDEDEDEDAGEDQDEDQDEARSAPPGGESAGRGPWEAEPFLEPDLGLSFFSSGGQTYGGIDLAAKAGLRYQERRPYPYLSGQTRVRAGYLWAGPDAAGKEVRLGSFLGPRGKILGAYTGPDVFWNTYDYGSLTLPATTGLAWEAVVSADLKVIKLYGGVIPAWYLSGDRPVVDWSAVDSFGFGHEFTRTAGIQLGRKHFVIAVSYSRRTTAYGDQVGLGLGLGL